MKLSESDRGNIIAVIGYLSGLKFGLPKERQDDIQAICERLARIVKFKLPEERESK